MLLKPLQMPPHRRPTRMNQTASQMAPPPRPARVGLPPITGRTSVPFMMPQFVEQGIEEDVEVGGSSGKRHRVTSPVGLGARSLLFADEAADEFPGSMHSGFYFSDLMSNGLSSPMGYANTEYKDSTQPDDNSVPDETPVVDDNTLPAETQETDDIASARGSHGRTKNFSVQQDLMIVSGWLNVSMDPISGVDQSKLAYWKRVHEYYHLHKTFTSDRLQGSLMNRWSAIRHDLNAFCGCISKIKARNQSGCTIDDKIQCAQFVSLQLQCAQFVSKLYEVVPPILTELGKVLNQIVDKLPSEHPLAETRPLCVSS